jgi:hypothetical protein
VRIVRAAAILLLSAGPFRAADLDQAGWAAILRDYVDAQARVDYPGLKQRGAKDLDAYAAAIATVWPTGMAPNENKAALINAYNALTMRWMAASFPVKSIWRTSDPFRKARHTVNGRPQSLDDIETTLRGMGDPRIHAALVCAARSCPPLRKEPYTGAQLDQQLDDNVRRWLANPAWNEFLPERRTARVSAIFDWYRGDFEQSGGVPRFLARFAPAGKGAFLEEPNPHLEYREYDWGLNDSGTVGAGYGKLDFYWDRLRSGLH